jgi:thioredoxin reductase (NADPH)
MGTVSLQPVSPYTSSISGRHEQAFPRLTESEIVRIARFGERRQYHRGERVFASGEPAPGIFVVLKGTLTMSQRDGLGHVVPHPRNARLSPRRGEAVRPLPP